MASAAVAPAQIPLPAPNEMEQRAIALDHGGYRAMDISEAGGSVAADDRDRDMVDEHNAGIETKEASPTMEYMQGLMQEFQRLEGKLSSLLSEHNRVHQENEELRNRPEPDHNAVQELETLTVKYNKVKKLYFQREQQVEDLTKELEAVSPERDELSREREELVRDLNTLTKDRDNAVGELEDITRERDSLMRERNTIVRERDAVVRERDAVVRERDTISRLKEEAMHDKQEIHIDREDVKLDRERLQYRVQELEGEVKSLQAQQQAQALANGVDKRRSAPASTGTSGGGGYTDEILKLKYDKVKRLYYDQMKTIDALHEQIRNMEAGKALDDPNELDTNSKGKQRVSYVSPERGGGGSGRGDAVDITPQQPQRRTSVRTNSTGKRNSNRMSMGPDANVI